MFGCNTHLLKHIKQAILAWSFRQNIILGCFPVFVAISARDEFIVALQTKELVDPEGRWGHVSWDRGDQGVILMGGEVDIIY